MVSDDFQKRDRIWDDKLPQPSPHAVTSHRQLLQKNSFLLSSSGVSEMSALQSCSSAGPAAWLPWSVFSESFAHRIATTLPLIFYLHFISLLASLVWRTKSPWHFHTRPRKTEWARIQGCKSQEMWSVQPDVWCPGNDHVWNSGWSSSVHLLWC